MSEITDKLQLICERGLRAGDTKIIREAIGLIETYGAIAAEATTDLKKSRERVAELEALMLPLNAADLRCQQRKRDELAAYLKGLRSVILSDRFPDGSAQQELLWMATRANPQVSLAEHDAEVARKAIDGLKSEYPTNEPDQEFTMCITNVGVQMWEGVWVTPAMESGWEPDKHNEVEWFIPLSALGVKDGG